MPPASRFFFILFFFLVGGSEANLQTSDGCVAPRRSNNEEQVTLKGRRSLEALNQAPPPASFVLLNVLRFLLCWREQSRMDFFLFR